MCARDLRSGTVAQELVVRRDLRAQEALLKGAGHADALEGAVRGNDAIPLAGGDFRRQEFAPRTGEIVFGGDEQPGVRIQMEKFPAKLF